jgi:Rad3-related DNA helicase
MLLGAVKGAPDPDQADYPEFVAQSISRLHKEIGKNILVLFTSNSMLNAVYNFLRADTSINNQKLLAQGLIGARHAILDQFKKNQMMILLGTDSFWEGVDAPGEACEIVIIPRLPFPVPSHPLTQALCKRMESVNGESFFSYSVPEAVIKFRQGVGRLIRSHNDRGACVVLDNRIISKGYGKQFLKSFDGSINSYNDLFSMVSSVKQFFEQITDTPDTSMRYVPIDEV